MNRFICFGLVLASLWAQAASPPPVKLRQWIIRAPEWDVVTWAADPATTDAKLADHLWKAVREGRARLVSDLTFAVEDGKATTVSTGQPAWLPTEVDQEFDRLLMTPISFEEFPIGASLECSKPAMLTGPGQNSLRFSSDCHIRFAPRGPLKVQWPTSWLNIYADGKLTDKAIHGWLDWHDLFEESIVGQITLASSAPALLGILPPADQVWPGQPEEKERWLDVFMGQASGAGPIEDASPISQRTLLLGIALPSQQVLELLTVRDPAEDSALLGALLHQVHLGKARLVLTAGCSNLAAGGTRATLTSARRHNFPTEMPSIPSAWEERPVGSYWQQEGSSVMLTQDLAPPGRSEWRLAQDVPGIVMWEPRFRNFGIEASCAPTGGVNLISVLHVPEVMRGPGLEADESVLVFARHHAPPSQPQAPSVSADPFDSGQALPFPQPQHYEAEIIVFEVPAHEESAWQPAVFGDATESDQVRLQALMKRLITGSAKLAAHMFLRVPQNEHRKCHVVEEYLTAKEFDPPELPNSPRMRPTGLDRLPVGTRWEIEVAEASKDSLWVYHTFENSTAKPIEPSLAETLAIAGQSFRYPGAVHHQETWKGQITIPLGQPSCLGTRNPPGETGEVRHVAFLRARRL